MTDQESVSFVAHVDEASEWLEPLRNRAIGFTLMVYYVIGLLLAGSSDVFRNSSQHVWLSLLVFLLLGLALVLWRWRPLGAAWILIVGGTATSLIATAWGEMPEGIWLLVVPVGTAALAIGIPWGAGAGLACTLALAFAPAPLLSAPQTTRVIAVVGIWAVVGLAWVATHSLLSPLHWAWSNYEHSRLALEQARDDQVRLYQITEDLTEANLQLNRLNRLAQALRQTAEDERSAKERFVANVSHELRTPLNMIIGFAEMITNAPEAYGDHIPAALLADLNVVLRNSQHLSSLIDDVLDLSQIEVGQMALTKERASLAEIVQSAVFAVSPLFESKHLYLETDLADTLPPVLCDRTRIREVVLNLLSNAGRFTERGGVKVRAHQDGRNVVVTVTDTGPGIAQENRARLFMPFEQLDGSIRRRYGGTGLGLSISKSFVELHDGKMWVESEVGQGTSFYFSLPIDPPTPIEGNVLRWYNPYEPYEERSDRPRLKPPLVRPRLVVVDGTDSMRRLLSRYVDGVDIVAAETLPQAFEELSRTPSQLLLINDIHISDTLQQVRDSEALPYGVPAIVCAIPGAGQTSDAMGVFDYLVKPISRQTLLASLDRLERPVKRILLVDDEPDALQLFGRMLSDSDRGYQAVRASDGAQALEIMRHEQPDVLLLDLVMPELDGFQLLAVKSRDPALSQIPVILISARDPLGQPIVSNSLAVTCRKGMSAREVLDCIDALSRILSRTSSPADRALRPERLD